MIIYITNLVKPWQHIRIIVDCLFCVDSPLFQPNHHPESVGWFHYSVGYYTTEGYVELKYVNLLEQMCK